MKMLHLIRQTMTEEMVLSITDDEQAPKMVKLNAPAMREDGTPFTNAKGEPIERLDVRVGDFDVVVEETPDVSTQSEEARQAMYQLMTAGIPPEKWTPTLLEVVGIPMSQRKRFEIERQQLVQEQAAQKQLGGAMGTAGAAGAVPSQLPQQTGV
jgi:hypothetical protein